MKGRLNIQGTLVILALLAVWEIAIRTGALAFDYLPAPSAIAAAGWTLLVTGVLLTETLHTLRSVLIGWAAASAIGIGAGLALGLSASTRRYVLASLEVLRPLPAIAFLPVALLLFNFSLTTELVVMVYASTWPVLVNTMGGVAGVAAPLHDVGRTLRLSRWRTLTGIVVPAALPAIVIGCRLSLGLCLVMAIIAEMLGNPHGLGYAIASELQAMQPERMFADIVVVGLLAIALNAAVQRLARFFLRGHPPEVAAHV
jgi:sulfonate transport system permease protein